MAFTYHPPTRRECTVCERIANKHQKPLISTVEGRASSADNFPIHNWYNFVLGYSPKFPDYIIDREKATVDSVIADPFMGSGTTNICAKSRGMKSLGMDANDFFHFAAETKLNWDVDRAAAKKVAGSILQQYQQMLGGDTDYTKAAKKFRTQALPERYISDVPLVKLMLLKKIIADYAYPSDAIKKPVCYGVYDHYATCIQCLLWARIRCAQT